MTSGQYAALSSILWQLSTQLYSLVPSSQAARLSSEIASLRQLITSQRALLNKYASD